MLQTVEEFWAEAQRFVGIFDKWVSKFEIGGKADHICYKCGEREEFEVMRRMFEGESAFVYQSIISGRRIAVIKFKRPLTTTLGEIWYLELADQKPDMSQKAGFDHIEVYPIEGDMERLAEKLQAQGIELKKVVRPHHTTYDGIIQGDFKLRLEDEELIQKIKREEM